MVQYLQATGTSSGAHAVCIAAPSNRGACFHFTTSSSADAIACPASVPGLRCSRRSGLQYDSEVRLLAALQYSTQSGARDGPRPYFEAVSNHFTGKCICMNKRRFNDQDFLLGRAPQSPAEAACVVGEL